MAFPATGARESLAAVFTRTQIEAKNVLDESQTLRVKSVAGTANAMDIMRQGTILADALDWFAIARATPGIGPYAQEQVNDPTLDLAAEFTAMVNSITTCRNWIVNNVPRDAGGFFLGVTILSSGRYQWRVFTAAQLSGLVTQLDAVITTIA